MKRSGESRNVLLSYILSFCSELYFPLSIWLFYYLRFLDFKSIALLTSLQILISIALDVPTGAIADLIGRKPTIILSFFLYGIGLVVQGTGSVFWVFLAAEVMKGVGLALYSGSLEALLYDTLKQQGMEHRYKKVVANTESVIWIAYFLSAIAGGIMYEYWFRLPYLATAVVYVFGITAAFLMEEPARERKKHSFGSYMKQNIVGFRELFADIRTARVSFMLAVIAAVYYIAANILGISQARQYGLNGRGVGILFAAGYIIAAVASQVYPVLQKAMGSKRLFVAVSTVLLLTCILAPSVPMIVGCALIIVRIASSTTFINLKSTLVNGYVSSHNRATAISTLNLLSKLPYAVGGYLIGAYIDSHSPNSFALVLGVSAAVVLAAGTFAFRFARQPVSR